MTGETFRESLASNQKMTESRIQWPTQHQTKSKPSRRRKETGMKRTEFESSLLTVASNSPKRSSIMSTKERIRTTRSYRPVVLWLCIAAACLCGQLLLIQSVVVAADEAQRQQTDLRSTQPTLDRQVESPSSGQSAASSPAAKPIQQQQTAPAASPSTTSAEQARASAVAKPQKPGPSLASQKKAAAALAAHRDYDKYQLKASSSTSASRSAAALAEASATVSNATEVAKQTADKDKEKANSGNNKINNGNKDNKQVAAAPEASESNSNTNKIGQLPNTRPQPKASAFSILKRFLPSFMTSAAVAATSVVADKQPGQNLHSRSSPAASSSLLSSLLSASASAGHSTTLAGRSGGSSVVGESSVSSPLSGKIINLLTGVQKKKGSADGLVQAIPNHAPFFMRKTAADRQAAGGGAMALASGLLSSPLKLGLLFSAPLLPSLLLTPLAIAGLSPAMSAINSFFGDDDEPATSPSAQSSLSTLISSGSSSPLASILQATGAAPFGADSSASSSSSSSSSSNSGNSLALQALQSFVLGPSSTTERPIFKPGVFASSGIQNAAGAISSAISSATGVSSQSGSHSNQRPFFGSGGGLMQAAASMISPSFAAPPTSSSSSNNNNDDDGPGLIQMASDVFEKVANYMGTDNTKDGQAIAQASSTGSSPANSPLSTLTSLSSMSPFQLSSLFASTPIATAISGSTSSPNTSIGNKNQRIGFFSTLRNVYELFSSSFLRRQEVGNENECQQRLVCELHQRAMNSKLFKRTLQMSLGELVNLDKNLIEQMKYNSQAIQARVDPDTKAMLSDFLKAANNFKSGREMINCSQMFPKCTRTQLLAAANAHLNDPANGRAIGKFSQLMKKMKFKTNQQNASQWKLRKPGKTNQQYLVQAARTTSANQPIDHMQVVPLQPQQSPALNAAGQLTPVDSLKLAQQIMMMSQMSQPQQQQQQSTSSQGIGQYTAGAMQPQVSQQQWMSQSTGNNQNQIQQQQPNYSAAPNYNVPQYSSAPKQQTTYTDAMMPSAYSPTESPYFISQPNNSANSQQQQQQQQQYSANVYQDQNQSQAGQVMINMNQMQQSGKHQMQPQQQYISANHDQYMPQQQQPANLGSNVGDNKSRPQQPVTGNKTMAPVA